MDLDLYHINQSIMERHLQVEKFQLPGMKTNTVAKKRHMGILAVFSTRTWKKGQLNLILNLHK